MAAAAYELSPGDYYDLGREALAHACEDPDIIYAFDRAGDNKSYPQWAVDALDTYGSSVRTLIQSGVPDSIAAKRASLVFGLTAPDQHYLDVAKSLSVGHDVLEAAADQALINHVSEYASAPVAKEWDESKVNRDEKGRFDDETGVSFVVINGERFSISEKVSEGRVKREPVKQVERANTDEEILAQAERRAELLARKERKNKKLKKLSRLSTLDAAHQAELVRVARIKAEAEKKQQQEAARAKSKAKGKFKEAEKYRGNKSSRGKVRTKVQDEPEPGPIPDDDWRKTLLDGFLNYTPPFDTQQEHRFTSIPLLMGNSVRDPAAGYDPIANINVQAVMERDRTGKHYEPVFANAFVKDYISRLSLLYTTASQRAAAEVNDAQEADHQAKDLVEQASERMRNQISGFIGSSEVPLTGSHIAVRGYSSASKYGETRVRAFVPLDDLIQEMGVVEPVPSARKVYYGKEGGHDGILVTGWLEDPDLHKWTREPLLITYVSPTRLTIGPAPANISMSLDKSWDEAEVVRDDLGRFADEGGKPVSDAEKERLRRVTVANAKRRKLNKLRKLQGLSAAASAAAVQAAPAEAQVEQKTAVAGTKEQPVERYVRNTSARSKVLTAVKDSATTNTKVDTSVAESTATAVATSVSSSSEDAQQSLQNKEPPVENGFKVIGHTAHIPMRSIPFVTALKHEADRIAVNPERQNIDGRIMLPPESLAGFGSGTKNIRENNSSVYMDVDSVRVVARAMKLNRTHPVALDLISGSGTRDDPFFLGDTVHEMTQDEQQTFGQAKVVKSDSGTKVVVLTRLSPGGARWTRR